MRNNIQNKRKATLSINSLGIFIIALSGIVTAALSDAKVFLMVGLIYIIIICYYSIFLKIKRSTNYSSIFCDNRFYFFTFILLYTVLTPIYCLLTLEENGGARVRAAYNATIYTSDELLKTIIMSTFFFLGIVFGFILREKTKGYNQCVADDDDYNNEENKNYSRKFICWFIVCIISTFFFYLPFIRGGFKIIQLGGSILDVDRTIATGVLGNLQDFFFSAEMMTASTVSMLYYAYKLNIPQRSRKAIFIVTALLQVAGALSTTRRARAFSIILCALVIYIYWYEKQKGKLPWNLIIISVAVVGFLYILEVYMGQVQTSGSIASYLRLFDGITAYDSLLLSTREHPSVSMLSNIVYGVFRPIPILGKYIVELFGIPNDKAPLYHWMAERYLTYQLGGGLAYTPQLEAYLSLGYFGCFVFGIIYGFVFGKKRHGLFNLFIIAMAPSVARGNLQILLKLLWPFGIVGFYFYDQFLFEKISFGRKTNRKKSSNSIIDHDMKG